MYAFLEFPKIGFFYKMFLTKKLGKIRKSVPKKYVKTSKLFFSKKGVINKEPPKLGR